MNYYDYPNLTVNLGHPVANVYTNSVNTVRDEIKIVSVDNGNNRHGFKQEVYL